MFDAEEMKEAVGDQLPPGWLNETWVNHSDLPDECHPTSFRCGDSDNINCTHEYRYYDEHSQHFSLQPREEARHWTPVSERHNQLTDEWEDTGHVHVDMEKHLVFLGVQMREVWVGRCPECGKVHYCVERYPNEWFQLSWNEPD